MRVAKHWTLAHRNNEISHPLEKFPPDWAKPWARAWPYTEADFKWSQQSPFQLRHFLHLDSNLGGQVPRSLVTNETKASCSCFLRVQEAPQLSKQPWGSHCHPSALSPRHPSANLNCPFGNQAHPFGHQAHLSGIGQQPRGAPKRLHPRCQGMNHGQRSCTRRVGFKEENTLNWRAQSGTKGAKAAPVNV